VLAKAENLLLQSEIDKPELLPQCNGKHPATFISFSPISEFLPFTAYTSTSTNEGCGIINLLQTTFAGDHGTSATTSDHTRGPARQSGKGGCVENAIRSTYYLEIKPMPNSEKKKKK
jgi:hypothetical protein